MKMRRRVLYGLAYGLILAVVTAAGVEFLSSFYVPAWPARALRSVEPATTARKLAPPFHEKPWLGEAQNSWGMRDVERTVQKPPGTTRVVFVGDSLVESNFTPLSVP